METIESVKEKIRVDLWFDYKEAMKRTGITQEDINKVRELVADDEVVPKFLFNSVVRDN